MKKNKAILAFCLVLLLLCATGCGSERKNAPEEETALASEEPAATQTDNDEAEAEEESMAAPVETEAVEESKEDAEESFVPKGAVSMEIDRLPAHWSIQELGLAVNEGEGSLAVRSDGLLVRYERDEDGTIRYYPVDHMGKRLTEDSYADVEELLPGLYTVQAFGEGVNNTGLLTEEGEMLIDCEAAIINGILNDYSSEFSQRFLLVVYGLEETENQDEAFFRATKSVFSFTPQEGDVFYTGYAKVYDLEKRAFVPDLTIHNSDRFSTRAGSNCFSYKDESGVTTLYGAEGKALFSKENAMISLGDGFALLDYHTVIDDQGEVLFESKDYLNLISGSGRFLLKSGYGDDGTVVYDYFGNRLFSLPGSVRVSSDGGGLFCCTDANGGMLYDMQGQQIVRVENIGAPSYEGYGIWLFYSLNDEVSSVYYLANGSTVEPTGKSSYALINRLEDAPEGSISIAPWNAPEEPITLNCSYDSVLCDALTLCYGDENVLLECFGGEILLKDQRVELGNDHYLYAQTADGLMVYELVEEY